MNRLEQNLDGIIQNLTEWESQYDIRRDLEKVIKDLPYNNEFWHGESSSMDYPQAHNAAAKAYRKWANKWKKLLNQFTKEANDNVFDKTFDKHPSVKRKK